MKKLADLTPSLGHPGGPCHVVRRIHNEVRAPRLRDQLDDQVEAGIEMSNQEASVVYRPIMEKGPGWLFRNIELTAHAQYRMDLRGIWTTELRVLLDEFLKDLNKWKNKKDPEYTSTMRELTNRQAVNYQDRRSGLVAVFKWDGRETATIITTYFKGDPDPSPPGLGGCPILH